MVLAFKSAKRLDADLEEGATCIAEGEEADEGTQRLAVDGKRPIVDEVDCHASDRNSGIISAGCAR
jgi:hypothetical protein